MGQNRRLSIFTCGNLTFRFKLSVQKLRRQPLVSLKNKKGFNFSDYSENQQKKVAK